MAIRTITWTVDEKLRITPRRVQDAGVQGEDNATRVEFVLPAFLQSGYTLYLDYLDNVNKYDKTDPLKVSDGKVAFDLPFEWTQHGGEAVVRLVAENDDVIDYTIDGRVRYADRSTALAKSQSLFEGSLQRAQAKIEKMIADAKVGIDNANGVYVGSGDMPDSCVIQIDPEGEALLLDNEMSDESENVPKTKVAKAYADEGDASTLSSAKAYADDVAKESAENVANVAKECMLYPGCFYRSSRYGGMEWLNPPMLPGVEYLTTERHNGEPVWVKLVELGNPPSCTEEYGVPKKDEDENIVTDENGNTVYTHYCKDVKVVEYGEIRWHDVWITRVAGTNEVMQRLPMHGNNGDYFGKAHVIQGKTIQLNFVKNATEYTVHALVKFTRPNIVPVTTEWERCMLERIDLATLPIRALRDVPKSPSGVTAAGDVLTGINYSSVFKDNSATTYSSANNRLVGTGTSLSTYYSSLENPASIMYTSGDVDLTSASWSSYYGMDCSGFVCYALGLGKWIWTKAFAGHETCGKENVFEKYCTVIIKENEETPDLSKVMRGDLVINTLDATKLDNGNHVKLVKDVLRDKDGNLLGFNIAESVQPYVRVVYMTPSEFLAQIAYDEEDNPQPYGVIRYDASKFSLEVEKVEYSKSVYPDMGDGGKYTVGDEVQLYIPDTTATAISVNGTTVALADLETAIVNDVTVYKLPIEVAGTYTIATDIAPDDPCTVIVKEV